MKKRGKKAQGLSFNVIVIAALAIIILVILIMILTGRVNIFQQSTTCAARNGVCMVREDNRKCPTERPISIITQDCELIRDGDPIGEYPGQCCIPLG